jgi:hypothetical protein
MRSPAFAARIAAAMIAVAAAARAGSSRLVYSRAPEASSCPDEAELRKAVARRFGYDPFFPWAKQTVVVQIFRAHARYVARVQLLDEQGIAQGTRELTSNQSDCSEIFEASALAVSIALDAPAKPQTQDARTEEPSPPPAPTPPPATTVSAPPPGPPSAVASSERPIPARPDAAARVQFDVGADVLASAGVTPAVTPGVSAFARARLHMWSLSLELRTDVPESKARSIDLGGGSVEAWTMAGGVAPCMHLGYFAVCAVGWIGALQASGQGVDPPRSRTTLFLAVGARLGFEWPFSSVLALRAHVEGVANLYPPTLVLGSDPDKVWSAPPVAGTIGTGLAVRFQ